MAIDIRAIRADKFFRSLDLLYKAGKDIKPVWFGFLSWVKKYFQEKWQDQGRPFGMFWKELNPDYRRWKKYNGKSGKADLIWNGDLFRAVGGGDGWFESVSDRRMDFGIDKVTAIHQTGGTINIPEQAITPKMRSFFWKQWYETNQDRWKALALSKVLKAHIVSIPQRPFFADRNGVMTGDMINKLEELTTKQIYNAYKKGNE